MSDQLKLALAALGAFVLGLFVGNIFRPIPPDVKAWEARVVRYQTDSAAYERLLETYAGERAQLEADAVKAEVARAAAVIVADIEQRSGARSKRKADSLTAALAHVTDSVPVLVEALAERTEEANAAHRETESLRDALGNAVAESLVLRSVINVQDSVIATMTNRLAIADDLLRDRPKTDRCKVLWMDCPSRTVTFVAGAVLGVAGTVFVGNK